MTATSAARTRRPDPAAPREAPPLLVALDDPFSAALRFYAAHGHVDDPHLRRLRAWCADERESDLSHLVRILGDALRAAGQR